MGTVASAIPSGTPSANVGDNETATGQASESKALLHPGGLQNIGNTCYLNSVIQMLKSSSGFENLLERFPIYSPGPIISSFFVTFSVQSTLDNDKSKWNKKEQLINSFAKVLNNLKSTSVFTPTELIIVRSTCKALFILLNRFCAGFILNLLKGLMEDYLPSKMLTSAFRCSSICLGRSTICISVNLLQGKKMMFCTWIIHRLYWSF